MAAFVRNDARSCSCWTTPSELVVEHIAFLAVFTQALSFEVVRDQESDVERLLEVESWVAERLVSVSSVSDIVVIAYRG